jgi:three-Cys-motif partner protein
MPSKDYFQWWTERIETLKGLKDEATTLHSTSKAAWGVGPWALLKLAIFAFYADVYTGIIKARFPQAYYLDLFAGPGLNRINETGDLILGSPLLADRVPKKGKKFDHMILIEKNKDDANALRKLLHNAEVLHRDVNKDGLDIALRSIPKSPSCPVLAFVDPEGLEIHWSTLEKLLKIWSDVMINYQPTSVRRVIGSLKNTPVLENSLNRYFGGNQWKDCGTDEELFQLYLSKIRLHKEVVIPIRVKGSGGFYYYIIVAVRRTGGEQHWIDAVLRAKEKIEAASSHDAERFLEIYKGTQQLIG